MKLNIPFKAALAAAVLSTPSLAHMFISSPSPIPGSAPKDPLDPSGSNFPCHGISLPASGGQKMAAGSKQTLAFNLGGGANTAVHGGGSCQMSITYETDAAKVKDPSNWKVIYSIEGGCPTDASGNLPTAQKCTTGDEVSCVNQFPFTIPKGVKDGHAIMAWTWFNNVGNREMYMNCINVEFSDGDGSEMKSFPTMFVANLASVDQCPTTENVNVKFPDPGKPFQEMSLNTAPEEASSSTHKTPPHDPFPTFTPPLRVPDATPVATYKPPFHVLLQQMEQLERSIRVFEQFSVAQSSVIESQRTDLSIRLRALELKLDRPQDHQEWWVELIERIWKVLIDAIDEPPEDEAEKVERLEQRMQCWEDLVEQLVDALRDEHARVEEAERSNSGKKSYVDREAGP
ncbi:hypothetical protein HII31_11660 [Pseudocercospora fuligena]|uniref:Chitin-binding type-4 domain-containing protein n=1 Tax=Pseudocercospora fuligena TaxID=685502 RepID=A0A8H6R6X5_9PEZI|nr:hypothetical protein HII31_11660 [Pseudocercospora fuligena]